MQHACTRHARATCKCRHRVHTRTPHVRTRLTHSAHACTHHTRTHTTHACVGPGGCPRPLSWFMLPACSGLRPTRQAGPCAAVTRGPKEAPAFQRQRKAPSGRAGAGGGESRPHGKGQDGKKKQFYFQSKKILQTVSGFKNVKRATKGLQPTVKVQSGTFTGELSAGRPPAGAQMGGHGPRLPRGRPERTAAPRDTAGHAAKVHAGEQATPEGARGAWGPRTGMDVPTLHLVVLTTDLFSSARIGSRSGGGPGAPDT